MNEWVPSLACLIERQDFVLEAVADGVNRLDEGVAAVEERRGAGG